MAYLPLLLQGWLEFNVPFQHKYGYGSLSTQHGEQTPQEAVFLSAVAPGTDSTRQLAEYNDRLL